MNRITWQAVALLATIGGVDVAMALTDWGAGDVLAITAVLGGIGGSVVTGSAITSGVASRVDQLQAETSSQSRTLETLDRRTNGELDARIAAGARSAVDQVVAELREQGVLR